MFLLPENFKKGYNVGWGNINPFYKLSIFIKNKKVSKGSFESYKVKRQDSVINKKYKQENTIAHTIFTQKAQDLTP